MYSTRNNNSKPSTRSRNQRPHGRLTQNKKVSKLDPNSLIKKAKPSGQEGFQSKIPFSQLPINDQVLINIEAKGYENMTYIQEKSIKSLLDGRDMLGISNTGSGKTAAFLIPIIEHALKDSKFEALIVTPTRELALQIEAEFKTLTLGLSLRSATFIGGTNINSDVKTLSGKLNVIVGTPGRLLDLANRSLLKFQTIQTLVLDEFDRMLDMGFVNDVKKIVSGMTRRKQTMLFSATLEASQKNLIDGLLNEPIQVKVNSGGTTSENVDQNIIRVPEGKDKFMLLAGLFDSATLEKVIIFTETKRLADRISKKLNGAGIKSGLIHGNKSQNNRNRTIEEFKNGDTRVLVATDVAARGIDVSDVTHVINYQLPMSMDSYIHRIGRTGRAGKTGSAITFVN